MEIIPADLDNLDFVLSHSWKKSYHSCGFKFQLGIFRQLLAAKIKKAKLSADKDEYTGQNCNYIPVFKPKYNKTAADYGSFWHEIIQAAFELQSEGQSLVDIKYEITKLFLRNCPFEHEAPASQKFSLDQNWRVFNAIINSLPSLLHKYELFDFSKWASQEAKIKYANEIEHTKSVEFACRMINISADSACPYIIHVDLILWNKYEHKPEVIDIKTTGDLTNCIAEQTYSTQPYGYVASIGSVLYTLNPSLYKTKIGPLGFRKFLVMYVDLDYKEPKLFLETYSILDELIYEWVYDVQSVLNRITSEMEKLPHLVRRTSACREYHRVCNYYNQCRLPYESIIENLGPAYSPLEIPDLTIDFWSAIRLWVDSESYIKYIGK